MHVKAVLLVTAALVFNQADMANGATRAGAASPESAAPSAGAPQDSVPPPSVDSDNSDPQTADTPADSSVDQQTNETAIVVTGYGQARQTTAITAREMALLTPGTSPIKAIGKLPGVNYQAGDAFGAYEWAVRISVRGFNQNQLGFTLDGIPLGDMSYGNNNGLHISRASISENLNSIEVSQGSGGLSTAATNNLGGTIQFWSKKPADTLGVTASGTTGSDSTYRAYTRIDSGDVTGHGLKMMASYAYLGTRKWKGEGHGRQWANQVNTRIQQDLGSKGNVSAFFNYSNRHETDYQDLSREMVHRLGWRTDNIAHDFPLAKEMARDYQQGKPMPAPFASVDDAYYNAAGLRKDILTGAAVDTHITDRLSFKLTGYYHHNRGQGIWFTPYAPTPGGAPLSVRTTEYKLNRGGTVGNFGYDWGPNYLEIGGWYEDNHFHQARRYYGLADADTSSRNQLHWMHDPFFTQREFRYRTRTTMYYVLDRLSLGKLTLSGGWKGERVRITAKPIVQGGFAMGKLTKHDWFLPQAGAVYRFNDRYELFTNYAKNMRAFSGAFTSGPFSTTQAGFDAIRNRLKPERSQSVEGGLRFREGPVQLSGTGYYIWFKNRLLALSTGPGIVGSPTVLQNVGKVHTYGAEFALNWKMFDNFSLYASYSYNHSKYQDNVHNADGSIYAATKGKYAVDTPKNMLKGQLLYDNKRYFARVGLDYMSKRYYTYENDQRIKGRAVVDATLGYRLTEGRLRGLEIEGNVTNLGNKRYFSTMGTNGFTTRGDNQTLMVGAKRQFFVTLRYQH